MWTKQHQALRPTRAAHGKLHRNRDAVAWPLSTFCRASGPTLFQMSLTAALWVAVFGKCGPPPDLPYALPASEMNQTDFESHTTLRYNCRPGYSRASSSQSLYCKPLGKWQINIACVKKSCRNPGDLQNGKVEVKTDFLFGSQIEFSCSEGYILIGSSTSYCEIQGKGVSWSDPLPECLPSVGCLQTSAMGSTMVERKNSSHIVPQSPISVILTSHSLAMPPLPALW
ncbi:C4b-binding protein alpha chain isoform X2 [Rattus norvegicus]|uniref:C4b-binding protein alpha chain isoform X2 n=1 Tax=Rattus norvegicus TaxID=10116 RepID=UPI002FD7E462